MTGKFRFRLQPVLEQRERYEREKRLAMGVVERERLGIEDRLTRLQQEIEDSKTDLRSRLGGGEGARRGIIAAADIRLQAGAAMHAGVRARKAALELAGVLRRQERARTELFEAARSRKAVELLKEKRLAEWRQERARADAAAVDEAGTQQFIRANATPKGGES